jgi:hypothetical protein
VALDRADRNAMADEKPPWLRQIDAAPGEGMTDQLGHPFVE